MYSSNFTKPLSALALAIALGIGTIAVPALASGGTTMTSVGVVDKLSSDGLIYNGVQPKGSVTLIYPSFGNPASGMIFSLSGLNVPDGSVLPVRVIMNRLGGYYAPIGLGSTEVDGSITVSHNTGSLVLNTNDGDVVPNFPLPTSGTTDIRILSPDGATQLLEGVSGRMPHA